MPIDRNATLKSAEKLLRQGNLDAAISEYERLIADQPKDWTSINALGDLYARAGQPDQAVAQFARVANHLLKEGSRPKAAAVLKKILRIKPGEPDATRHLETLAKHQAADRASKVTAAREAVNPPDPDAKVALSRTLEDTSRASALLVEAADIYLASQRFDEGVAALAEASGYVPANTTLRARILHVLIDHGDVAQARRVARTAPELLIVAEALEQQGQHLEAVEIWIEAGELDPQNAHLRERLVREFAAAGDLERARRVARSPNELLAVADALIREGRRAEAVDVIEEAAQRSPEDDELRLEFIDACSGGGEVERARRVARSPHELLAVAEALRRQGRRPEALDTIRQALQRDPTNTTLHTAFVRECVEVGDLAQARSAASTPAELVMVAEALERQGERAQALDLFADASRGDPNNAELRMRVARACALAGDLARSMGTVRDVSELVALSDFLEQQGRASDAREIIRDAVRRDPNDAALRMRALKEYARAGDRARAVEVAQSVPELLAVAELFEQAGHAAQVGEIVAEASRRDPDNLELRMRVARDAALAGDLDRAMSSAQTIPELLAIADLLERAGRAPDARSIVAEASRRDPYDVDLRMRVARECALAGDLRGAMSSARTIPELLGIADLLGQQGRASQAREILVEASRRDPDDAALRMRIARECALAGDLPAALAAARTALEVVAIAELLEQHGRAAEAPAVIAEASRRDPDNADLRMRVARDRALAGDLAGAMASTRTVPELLAIAGLLEQQGRATDVPTIIAEASRRDPANVDLRMRVARDRVLAGDLAGAMASARTVPELLKIAELLEQQGKTPEIPAVIAEASRRDPENVPLRMRVARDCVLAGDLAGAMASARTVSELLTVAALLEQQGRPKEVPAVVAEASRRDPENVELRMRVARDCVLAGDLTGAMASARTVPELLTVAALLEQQGRTKEVPAVVAEASRRDPENVELRVRVARDSVLAGDVAGAMAAARTVPELLTVAELLEQQGNAKAVPAVIAEASKRDPANAELRMRVARDYVLAGDVAQAMRTAQTGAELMTLAELLEQQGRTAEACDVVDEAAERDPANADLRMRAARQLVAAGQVDRARRHLRTAPECVQIAHLLKERGSPEALALMREAIRLDPDDAALRLRVAREFTVAGDMAGAMAIARTVRELLTIAELLELHKRPSEIPAVIAEASRRDPANAELRMRVARDCVLAGDLAGAMASAPTVPELLTIAGLLEQQGRATEVPTVIAEASRRDPDNADLRMRVARDRALAGDLAGAMASSRTVLELLTIAELLEQQGRAADVRTIIAEASKRDPDDSALRMRLARDSALAGDLADAMASARTVPELLSIAELLEQQGRAEDVRTIVAEASKRDPNDSALRMRVARDCVLAGDLAGAMASARTVPELLTIAELLEQQRRPADVRTVIAEASRRDPDDAALRMRVARDCVLAGDLAGAMASARTVPELLTIAALLEQQGRAKEVPAVIAEASRRDPGNAELRMRVARDHVLAGDIAQAMRTAQTGAELMMLAELLEQQGRTAEVSDVIDEAAERDPANAELRMRAARHLVTAGDVDRARRHLRTAQECVQIADLLKERGSPDALALMREAVRLDPDDAALRMRAARDFALAGDVAGAIAAARTVSELLAIADALEQQGRATEVPAVIAEASRRDPGNAELRMRAARDLVLAGDIAQAMQTAQTGTELMTLAELLEQHGRAADACNVMDEAAERDPANAELRMRAARQLAAAGDVDRARRHLRTAQECVQIADLLKERGSPDALALMREAVRLDPDDAAVRMHAVRDFALAGDVVGAIAAARTVSELLAIADVLEQQGRASEVPAVIAEASRRDPGNAELRMRAARDHVLAGDIAQAMRTAQTGTELMTLAELLEQQGRTADVCTVMDEAAERDPANAVVRMRAARQLAVAGEVDRARRHLRTASECVQIADLLKERGSSEAVALMREAVRLDPDDAAVRMRAARDCALGGDVPQAMQITRTVPELLELAEFLEQHGSAPDARIVIEEAALRDPANEDVRMRVARDLVAAGDLDRAARHLQTAAELEQIANLLKERGRSADAIRFIEQAVGLDPDNSDLRMRLAHEWLAAGDLERATRVTQTKEELLSIAQRLDEQGRKADALIVRADAAAREPGDLDLNKRVALEYLAAGDLDRVRRFLTLEIAGDDPDLVMMHARLRLEAGDLNEGRRALNHLLLAAPERRDDLVLLGCDLADRKQVDAAYACIELASDMALLDQDWPTAASALHEFVTRVPNQIPALMKLVEICVEGGLESTMQEAQTQLADAYLAAGKASAARVIAEDLVVREPWARTHVDRLRRTLSDLGVASPDKTIADMLCGENLFMSMEDTGAADVLEEDAEIDLSGALTESEVPGDEARPR